jgi:undecaprenyl-diphosphatase
MAASPDVEILRFVREHMTSGPMDGVMVAITDIGRFTGMTILGVILVVALLALQRPRDAVFAAVAMSGSYAINVSAKATFRRERPDLWPSIAPETSFSLPSGHAMAAATFSTVIIVLLWDTRWRWLAIGLGVPFALVMGFTRVYLGVHYPSDVVAGWLVAVVWVAGLSYALRLRPHREPELEPDQDLVPGQELGPGEQQ